MKSKVSLIRVTCLHSSTKPIWLKLKTGHYSYGIVENPIYRTEPQALVSNSYKYHTPTIDLGILNHDISSQKSPFFFPQGKK